MPAQDGGPPKAPEPRLREPHRVLELRDRQALLSEAEELAGAGSYLWEPGREPIWSDGFFRILGYRPGEVTPSAEAFFGRLHPGDRERIAALYQDAREGNIPECEYRILRADTGEVRYGSCFTVWLPAVDVARCRAASAPKAGPARGPGGRVLVVDDVTQVRRVAALSLRAAGFEVSEAAGGREALALVEAGAFDLVLTDACMPKMSGEELAHALRERFPALPVILMTGFSDTAAAFDLPVLHKPVSVDDLVSAVRNHLHVRG